MNAILTAFIVAACLLAAVWKGMWLRRFLPEDHLSPDSKDTVKLAMGLVATMAALVLGLLVSSAKASYDTTRAQVMEKASKYSFLDRLLEIYGPQAAEGRGELRVLCEGEVRRLWRDGSHSAITPDARHHLGNMLYLDLLKLEARDEPQKALKAQAVSVAVDLGQLLSLMEAESTTSISPPMLIVVVFWLIIIFLGFSVIAPPNNTTRLALLASTWCAAGAIFLILELDRPFDGLLRISSEPMLKVLAQIGK